jgi:hypothetical protein
MSKWIALHGAVIDTVRDRVSKGDRIYVQPKHIVAIISLRGYAEIRLSNGQALTVAQTAPEVGDLLERAETCGLEVIE